MLLKLFISLIVFPLLLPNSNKVEVNKVKEASLGSSALHLAHAPYLLTLSLGDDLYLEGLIVKDNDTLIPHHLLSFSGHAPKTLVNKRLR